MIFFSGPCTTIFVPFFLICHFCKFDSAGRSFDILNGFVVQYNWDEKIWVHLNRIFFEKWILNRLDALLLKVLLTQLQNLLYFLFSVYLEIVSFLNRYSLIFFRQIPPLLVSEWKSGNKKWFHFLSNELPFLRGVWHSSLSKYTW